MAVTKNHFSLNKCARDKPARPTQSVTVQATPALMLHPRPSPMSDPSTRPTRSAAGPGLFPPTHWTMVIKARDVANETQARQALEVLCRAYWYPLYAFARRLGHPPHDAQDVTQGFFAYLLEKDLFAQADRTLGKMRTFLLTAFTRYSGRIRAREKAQKRGGGQFVLSIDADFDVGERRYRAEPADRTTPEEVFSRTWAQSVLDAARESLAQSEGNAGRGDVFAALEAFLERHGRPDGGYESLAATLGMAEDAVRQAVSRLRRRYKDAVRAQIASTLRNPTEEQIEAEMASLRHALG